MRTMDEWLASEETGEAFSHCVRCKFPLVEIAEPWLVNKEIIRDECVLEYAICQPCRDAVTAQFSEGSKESVRDFLESEIDWDARIKEFMLAHELTDRFGACISCRKSREILDGYGLSALYDSGGKVVEGALPLLICLPCVGRMTASLSDSSRAVWRKFLSENFDGPPGDAGLPGML